MRTLHPTHNTPVLKLHQPDDNHKFRALPAPSGKYPYHLDITSIVQNSDAEKMVFHMVGDTGGIGRPEAREEIVTQMSGQYCPGGFLYHLGDLVYHYGEASQYAGQFFKPFERYPGPVLAIAGNHDSDINPDAEHPIKAWTLLCRFSVTITHEVFHLVKKAGVKA
jgi:hypothetical protein